MKCISCGKDLNSNDKFCANCGKIVESTETPVQNIETQPKKSNKVLWIVLGVVGGLILLFIIMFVAIFMFIFKSVEKEIKNYPDISDYEPTEREPKADKKEAKYEFKDPTGHTIKIIEDSYYKYVVDTSYLKEKEEKLTEKAKIISEEEIDKLVATEEQKKALKDIITYMNGKSSLKDKLGVKEKLKKEGYDDQTIEFAINNCKIDWEERAIISAYNILQDGTPERDLHTFLRVSFSEEIAKKVLENESFDFYEQALYEACHYRFHKRISGEYYSKDEVEETLKIFGFTEEETKFAIDIVYEKIDFQEI